MIELNKHDKQLILLCKGHLQKQYPFKGEWTETLKPIFRDYWGWDPDEDNNYQDYLRGAFNRLLDLYLKIKDDWTGCNGQLKEIFSAAFYIGITRDQELPIERAISQLCGLIQCNSVVNDKKEKRYDLTL
jgi:hypothetical protein